jgi:hypothetical protein
MTTVAPPQSGAFSLGKPNHPFEESYSALILAAATFPRATHRKSRKTRVRRAEMDAATAAIQAVADEVKVKQRSQKIDRSGATALDLR